MLMVSMKTNRSLYHCKVPRRVAENCDETWSVMLHVGTSNYAYKRKENYHDKGREKREGSNGNQKLDA